MNRWHHIMFEGITKMSKMSQRLYAQMEESGKLNEVIRKNLEVLGYGE